MNADKKRLSLERRDELEYLAAFMNPEAISKIISDRKSKEALVDSEVEAAFAAQVKATFGKDLKIPKSKIGEETISSSLVRRK